MNIHTDIEAEILRLKKELNAVILSHYYQESRIQDIADFVGDSLELSRKARETTADAVVFAGVYFMAETAKILNPNKKVIIPDVEAGCSLADNCPALLFKAWRDVHPDHIAVTYINSSAEVKALSDIIVTSSNAEKIVRQIPEDKPILFAPDKNLGRYLMKKTGRKMKLWEGTCVVHEAFSDQKILELKIQNPEAKVIAHPECEDTVLEKADFIGSTSALLKYVQTSKDKVFIVVTEPGIIHQMKRFCPDKIFISVPSSSGCAFNECPYMRKNTLEKLYLCMKNQQPEVTLPDDIIERALIPLNRMFEMSK